jgi:putative transposase
VISIYPRRSFNYTIKFHDEVIEEMPFPIRRIQTDRGKEFFAIIVQENMMDYCIKFHPIKPRSPHLNGKV